MAAQLDVARRGILQGGSAMSAWPASINQKQPSGAFWEEEVVQLMMGRPLHHHLDVTRPSSNSSSSSPPLLPVSKNVAPCSTTLDLLGASSSSSTWRPPPFLASENPESSSSAHCFDLDADAPLPSGWEKCLDLQTGNIYYLNRSTGLSTSCDPRKVTTSSVNWPTSPSSSSDLTVEASVPIASSSKRIATTSILEEPSKDSTNLDLTLSLGPSSPCLRPHSLKHAFNHDLNCDLNHKIKSLISSQGPLDKQTFSALPFNSARMSFTLPSATTIAPSSASSSPSTLFFRELSALKDKGSLATSMSSKESKSMSMNESVNGICRHISSNVSMSVGERPFRRETLSSRPVSKNFSVSAKAKPIISDTHTDGSSPMMTMGCANCLMFVMLPKSHSPKCPRCGASIDSDLSQPPSGKKPKLGLSLMS